MKSRKYLINFNNADNASKCTFYDLNKNNNTYITFEEHGKIIQLCFEAQKKLIKREEEYIKSKIHKIWRNPCFYSMLKYFLILKRSPWYECTYEDNLITIAEGVKLTSKYKLLSWIFLKSKKVSKLKKLRESFVMLVADIY